MQEKLLSAIAEARLIDDTFMSVIFEDLECVQVLLDHFIPEEGFIAESVQTQVSLQNLHGRSVRLDIVAQDRNGRRCNIEIQRSPEGASPKRARYNNALLDMDSSNPGEGYDQLPDTYTIFLSEHDVLKTRLPLIHIVRMVRETGEEFRDGSYILYVDTQNKEDTPLGHLMQDLYCRKVRDISNPTLRKNVGYYKETKGGRAKMCEIIEKVYGEQIAESIALSRKQGREEYRVEITYANLRKYLANWKSGAFAEAVFVELAEMTPAEAEAWIREYEEKIKS